MPRAENGADLTASSTVPPLLHATIVVNLEISLPPLTGTMAFEANFSWFKHENAPYILSRLLRPIFRLVLLLTNDLTKRNNGCGVSRSSLYSFVRTSSCSNFGFEANLECTPSFDSTISPRTVAHHRADSFFARFTHVVLCRGIGPCVLLDHRKQNFIRSRNCWNFCVRW